jgi:beta-N-acetylhexosaminidase
MQHLARIPLIISADFERGIGSTVSGAVELVGNMCLGAAADEGLAHATGKAIAEEASAMGVNMNYVPVMDVNTNAANPIINIRSFGADPEMVGRLGAALVRGSREGGVLTCAKHFPGHGGTHEDTHTDLATISAGREELEAVELLPFRHAIEAGVDAVMTAHLRVPAIEPDLLPATLSPRIIRGLLREEMGFGGVVVSDALDMGAIARNYPPEEAVVRALNAGVDQLIMPRDSAFAVGALCSALRDGRVSEARIDEAVGRVLSMKEAAGILASPAFTVPPDLLSRVDTPAHRETALRAALSGITLARNEGGLLPLSRGVRLAVISFSNHEDARMHFMEPRSFGAHCSQHVESCEWVHCGTMDDGAMHAQGLHDRAKRIATEADAVILAVYTRVVISKGTLQLDERFIRFAEEIAALGRPVGVVAFGSPYTVSQFPMAGAAVCVYGSSEAAQQAAAMLVTGQAPFRGRLPVPLVP